jgi:hypothetical protein
MIFSGHDGGRGRNGPRGEVIARRSCGGGTVRAALIFSRMCWREDLAHLFSGHSLRRFRGFALLGRLGEPGGAVTRQCLLGETMLFVFVLR